MEPGAPVVFERGKAYTRGEVAAALGGGGSRAVFPSRGGKVLAVCAAGEYNPRAPAEVIAGPGTGHVRAARRLAAAGEAVPVFVRRSTGKWEFAGERRVAAVIDDPAQVGERAAEAARAAGAVVLVLDAGDGSAGGSAAPGS